MDGALDFVLNRPDGDPEDPLPPAEYIDQLLFGMGRVDGLAIAEQCHVRQWPFGFQLLAENLDRGADLLEAHPGVEKALDHLELDNVGE